jgi:hypothetical protein
MWAEMLQTGQSDRVPSHYRQLAINQEMASSPFLDP